MDYPWIIHGLSIHNPWIIHGYPWIIQRYQGILFVTKWHAIQVERISTRPTSMIVRCASLQILRFPGFHFSFSWIPVLFSFILGAPGSIQGSSRISLEAAGVSRDHFGGILYSSDFPRNPKIIKNWLLSVSRDIFDEIRGNRCGTAAQSLSNHRFY